jgi:hypothetical protein
MRALYNMPSPHVIAALILTLVAIGLSLAALSVALVALGAP